MPEAVADGLFVQPNFLSPFVLVEVLDALDRLSANWTQSQDAGLLGRGQTGQIRAVGAAAQAQLDKIRLAIAPATLAWAKACGFRFPRPPHLQLFPVRMVGDAKSPAYQEPHVDSHPSQPGPPICTSVFYARAQDVVGGELAVAATDASDLSDPILIQPKPNTLVSLGGDRVHWVKPLYAGERLSLVINLY
jgi:hypothetical protein